MIRTFKNQLAENLFDERPGDTPCNFPLHLWTSARYQVLILHDAAALVDLEAVAGNNIGVFPESEQFRYWVIEPPWCLTFQWRLNNAYSVAVEPILTRGHDERT